jgi:hypothetical protein
MASRWEIEAWVEEAMAMLNSNLMEALSMKLSNKELFGLEISNPGWMRTMSPVCSQI